MDSNEVREQWADRSGAYSPDYYAHYGPNETSELLAARFEDALDSDAAILELGCSSGRHLAHLRERGFEDLHGIEINDEAFDVMADAYPGLADAGTFYADAIESVVPEFPDDRFDAVYSVETLQHVHPDSEWVFGEIARIADSLLVTVENEDGTGGSEDGGDGRGDGNEAAGDRESDDRTDEEPRDVNYVHGEFPLYYRNWAQVFPEHGFREVAATDTKRDTLRVFRPGD